MGGTLRWAKRAGDSGALASRPARWRARTRTQPVPGVPSCPTACEGREQPPAPPAFPPHPPEAARPGCPAGATAPAPHPAAPQHPGLPAAAPRTRGLQPYPPPGHPRLSEGLKPYAKLPERLHCKQVTRTPRGTTSPSADGRAPQQHSRNRTAATGAPCSMARPRGSMDAVPFAHAGTGSALQ